jgi:hypothetical protein
MDDAAHVRISPPGRFAWLLSFTRGQSAGGLALMVAPVAALAWSDSPGSARCFHPMELPIGIAAPAAGPVRERRADDAVLPDSRAGDPPEMTEGQLVGLSQNVAPGLAALGA